jgi:16S rRNA (cytosine967-C5)-methyltransferase
MLTELKTLQAEPLPHPVVRSAIAVSRGINLRALPASIRNRIEIQDLASQVTSIVCEPKAGQHWWDACAGSGGKALHLATQIGNSGSILATDIRPTILGSLDRRLAETGIRTIKSAVWDGAQDAPPAGPFDGILLDAPCSGMGTWHRNPDARWRLKESRVTELSALQSHLLKSCAGQLKNGGILVYATCTLPSLENESVISSFLKTEPSFQLTPFINPLTGGTCNGTLLINPWDGPCNGMYIAKLKRIY